MKNQGTRPDPEGLRDFKNKGGGGTERKECPQISNTPNKCAATYPKNPRLVDQAALIHP